jgi:hypothetical protein
MHEIAVVFGWLQSTPWLKIRRKVNDMCFLCIFTTNNMSWLSVILWVTLDSIDCMCVEIVGCSPFFKVACPGFDFFDVVPYNIC